MCCPKHLAWFGLSLAFPILSQKDSPCLHVYRAAGGHAQALHAWERNHRVHLWWQKVLLLVKLRSCVNGGWRIWEALSGFLSRVKLFSREQMGVMRKGWKGLAWVIPWIYLIWGNSWDSLIWPFLLFPVPVRDYKLLPLSRDLGHPTWNSGGGGLCTAMSSDTTTCWLSMEIIHTYKMNKVRTMFPLRNLRWAIWRHSSGRNLFAQIEQVCIQPPDLNIPRYVFCLHMGKHMFSQFQFETRFEKIYLFWYLAENLFI